MNIEEIIRIETDLLRDKIIKCAEEFEVKYQSGNGFNLGQIVYDKESDEYGMIRFSRGDRVFVQGIGSCLAKNVRAISDDEYSNIKDHSDFKEVEYHLYITDSVLDYGKDDDSNRKYLFKTIASSI